MKYIILVMAAYICAAQFTYADDIYLKTGYVYRNVFVIDTTDSWIRIINKDDTTAVRLSYVARVEKNKADLSKPMLFELYSQETNKAYTDSITALVAARNKMREDSLATYLTNYMKVFPLYNNFYVEISGGIPNMVSLEAAYTIRDYASAGFYVSLKNNFTKDNYLGFAASIYLPSIAEIFKPLVHITFNKFTASGAFGCVIPLGYGLFASPAFGLTQYYRGIDSDKGDVTVQQNFYWALGLAAVLPMH
jgi:hypothetical protein